MATLSTPIPANYTEVLGNIVDYYGINLFDFDYTLYTPADTTDPKQYKADFEREFIDYFYFREIGQETIDLFKHYLRVRWQTIIGRYNLLFEASSSQNANDAFTNDNFNNAGISIFNDTPKGEINFDDKHATNFTRAKNTNTGLRGITRAEALRRYRNELISAREDFFDEFSDLFFALYGGKNYNGR